MNKKNIWLHAASALVIAVLLVFAVGSDDSGSSSSYSSSGSSASSGGLPNIVFGWEVLAQKKMKQSLKDPGSAEYENVHVYKLPSSSGKPSYVFCGEVNAKNSFGAYNGYHRFIATAAGVMIAGQTPKFSKLWSLMCNPENDLGPIAF